MFSTIHHRQFFVALWVDYHFTILLSLYINQFYKLWNQNYSLSLCSTLYTYHAGNNQSFQPSSSCSHEEFPAVCQRLWWQALCWSPWCQWQVPCGWWPSHDARKTAVHSYQWQAHLHGVGPQRDRHAQATHAIARASSDREPEQNETVCISICPSFSWSRPANWKGMFKLIIYIK